MKKKNNAGPAVGIGVGVAAAAAAAGGAYWLYGAKHSAQHRKLAKSWMLKARAEVMDALEKVDDVDKDRYMKIVETVLKTYAAAGATSQELGHVMKDFKSSWKHIQGKKSVRKSVKKIGGKAKRAGKKAAKKAKKAVSKR